MENYEQYIPYISIPVISALIGFVTNWLAVKMTFFPIEYVGIKPFGWQGIIPANAKKMARIAVDTSLRNLIDLDELADRVDAREMFKAVNQRLDLVLEDLVDEIMSDYQPQMFGRIPVPNVWEMMPVKSKQLLYAEVRKELPDIAHEFVEDIKFRLEELVDINEIVVQKLSDNKALLNDIFLLAAKNEFLFLIRSGFYFGLPLGIPVMFLWHFFPSWWILPLCGGIIGWATNKLAMHLIGKPIDPVHVGPFKFQGLFIKRQSEVAEMYGEVYAEHLINSEVFFEAIMRSDASDTLFKMMQRNLSKSMEKKQGILKPLVMFSMGSEEYKKFRDSMCDKVFAHISANPPKEAFAYADEALDVRGLFSEKVGSMPSQDFYELLAPAVEQEKWKVVFVGAVLGAYAGYLQWAFLT